MTEKEAEKWSERMDGQALHSDRAISYVRWGVSKQNYDVTPHEKWFKRSEGGVLLPATDLKPARKDSPQSTNKGGLDNDNW